MPDATGQPSNEYELKVKICSYIKTTYPSVLFQCDLVDMLNGFNGLKAKPLRSCNGLPDLHIAEPRGGSHGLYLEIKFKPLTFNKHEQQQADVIVKLCAKGYKACFVVGFDKAKEIIDEYLKNEKTIPK